MPTLDAKAPAFDFRELRSIDDLQQELAHLFPSRGSIDWELRINRARYIRGRALFAIGGRLLASPARFKAVALKLAAERARVWKIHPPPGNPSRRPERPSTFRNHDRATRARIRARAGTR